MDGSVEGCDDTTLVARCKVKRREAVFAWDRRLKAAEQPLSRSRRKTSLRYLPFWRIGAIVAQREKVRPVRRSPDHGDEIEGSGVMLQFMRTDVPLEHVAFGDWAIKPWNLTVPAFDRTDGGLESLGVRAETVPLMGRHQANIPAHAICRPATTSREAALERFARTVGAVVGEDVASGAAPVIIAPRVDLIYWPVWFLSDNPTGGERGIEIDGQSGRVIRENKGLPPAAPAALKPVGEGPKLLPHRCPDCGSDLPIEQMFVVYLCHNCSALIAHDGRGGRSVVEATFAEIDDARGYAWYPFWVFAHPKDVLVPAFSISNYRNLVKFGAIMSGRERRCRPSSSGMRRGSGVSLPVDVAAGLAGLIAERRYGRRHACPASVSESPAAGASVPESRLVFLPLKRVGTELLDPVTELCLSCSPLAPA